MNLQKRQSGILLPIFSLPSFYGIGCFDEAAYKFVDFLKDAGQSIWQILPLNPTSYGDSPYQSASSFAGNPYFISLTELVNTGLLEKSDLPAKSFGNIDYYALYKSRPLLFKKAFENFVKDNSFNNFVSENSKWLDNYCLFAVLKELSPTTLWSDWQKDVKFRKAEVIESLREKYAREIEYHAFIQYLFFTQWKKLKQYAFNKGISILGDIPIYTALDCAEVWTHPHLFELDENLLPKRVAGCPPDDFSIDGQLWGNPLYDWAAHKKEHYGWWIRRMSHVLTMFDAVRIDHFRGFEAYWAIPFGDKTAENGVWEQGAGEKFIRVINEWFNFPPIVAENLGHLTNETAKLLDFSGYPGMKVLQFGLAKPFGESEHLPHNYDKNTVAYTGTHDNDTSKSVFESLKKADKKIIGEYLGISDNKDIGFAFARTVQQSIANISIIPLPDYLNLGKEARINTPATLGGTNWQWRLKQSALTAALAKRIKALTEMSGR